MIPKYRAWHKEDSKMIEVGEMDFNTQSIYYNLASISFDDFEIMQFIGRTSENGDEIYADYIISVIEDGYAMGYYYENEYIGVVKYDHDLCVYYVDLIEKSLFDSVPDVVDGISIGKDGDEIERYYFNERVGPEDIHILGNIYENPGLLGE